MPERFAELCRRLKTDGLTPVLVGGDDDKDLGARIAREGAAIDLIGRTDLEELKSLMGRLELFVTNDSGPMHLAAASGVPVVAIFGATTRELGFFPYGPGHRVVEADLACRPCGLHGARECPAGHFLCMRLVTVDQVHEACRWAARTEAA
ncbi:MAG: glycosyltransferase family 9 protein [Elusimicrobia bacterium]|nr:glycosyltransferase family 9 protein [Elusimicrobiota bacterium]